MGNCVSSTVCFTTEFEPESRPPTAKVVSINGDLHEYHLPVSVSQVLHTETSASSSSSSSTSTSSLFLCNSDMLSYDEYIPELNPAAQLQPSQIYFVLPKSRLESKLTATGMAALAVKASVAMQNSSKDSHKRKKARISPVISVNQTDDYYQRNVMDYKIEVGDNVKMLQKPMQRAGSSSAGFSRSGSVRRFQKYTSRRAKWAVRSFRLRLSTIHEGTVLG